MPSHTIMMPFNCKILTVFKDIASLVPSWILRLRNALRNRFANIGWKALANAIWQWMKTNPGKVALIVTAVALIGATPAILGAIGFTVAGPVAGSLAAAVQASIGNVAAGSLFAVLQSAALGGYGVGIMWGVGLGFITALVGIITAFEASYGEEKMKTC